MAGIYISKRERVGRPPPFHVIITFIVNKGRRASAGKQVIISCTGDQGCRPAAAKQKVGTAAASGQRCGAAADDGQ